MTHVPLYVLLLHGAAPGTAWVGIDLVGIPLVPCGVPAPPGFASAVTSGETVPGSRRV